MTKEREAASAALTEQFRPKTALQKLIQEGPASLAAQPQPTRSMPAPFVLPEEQKGRVDQTEARQQFAQQIAQQDAARFAETAVQQREAERAKPISEMRPDVKDFEDYKNDGFGEAIKRSDRFTRLFQDKLESGATVDLAYMPAGQDQR